MYSTKLSERNLFRLFWKNILTGLKENYMFKSNCRFYDFHPASQAYNYCLFAFGRLVNFRQILLRTAAGSWRVSGAWTCQSDTRKNSVQFNTEGVETWIHLSLEIKFCIWQIHFHGATELWKSQFMLHWRPQLTEKQSFLFKVRVFCQFGLSLVLKRGILFEVIKTSCLYLLMIVKSTCACLTSESVTSKSCWGRWGFLQYSRVEILDFFSTTDKWCPKWKPWEWEKRLPRLLGKRIRKKDNRSKDVWGTQKDVLTISDVEFLFLGSPAAWNIGISVSSDG